MPLTANWSALNLPQTELLVVACTPHFFGTDYVQRFSLHDPYGIPVSCDFTNDVSMVDQADALWFHYPLNRWHHKPEKKRPGQKWILATMESDENYPLLKNQEFLQHFDITMTYNLDADVPTLYPSWHEYGGFMGPVKSIAQKNQNHALAAYIASNPVEHRDSYVQSLMQHIPVDCLGSCLNNRQLADFTTGENIWARGGWTSIINTIGSYKFYLAFENSIAKDYVTERVFHALYCGTVPIYLGAENVREFMPTIRRLFQWMTSAPCKSWLIT